MFVLLSARCTVLQHIGKDLPAHESAVLFAEIDGDGSGAVDFEEFLTVTT